MKITRYNLQAPALPRSLRIALVADLHAHASDAAVQAVQSLAPDLICLAGDMTEALDGTMDAKNEHGFAALRAFAAIAPTFYAPGNHEIGGGRAHMRKYPRQSGITAQNRARIEESGVHFLDNTFTEWQGIAIGGLGSGVLNPDHTPDLAALQSFYARQGYKILLCHHPEYYTKYLREQKVNLVLAGHAHGGQWRLLGKSIYAPDQGLFPGYAHGLHDGKLIVTSGAANTARPIPRLGNPREVVCIDINQEV